MTNMVHDAPPIPAWMHPLLGVRGSSVEKRSAAKCAEVLAPPRRASDLWLAIALLMGSGALLVGVIIDLFVLMRRVLS